MMRNSLIKTLEHSFKRAFFTFASVFLKRARKDFGRIDPLTIKRVLFIRPEKLGDMIISLPVFHNLKKFYPHIELFTISSPRNVAIVDKDERIFGNFLYTKNIFADLDMLRRVRGLEVNAVVDMVCDDSVTALFLTQLSSPRAWRIGVGKNRHRKYYDFNYSYRANDDSHVLDNTLKLLTAFGLETDQLERQVPPTIPPEIENTARSFIASLNRSAARPIIGLNISAGRPTRVWQTEKNEQLLARVLETYPDAHLIISADPRERDRAVELSRKFSERVLPLPAGLNLLEVSAIISRLCLLITPDTSLVHIARAFGVPVVGLYTRFGKNFRLWKPYNQDGGTVVSGNDYNIHDIEVDEVFQEVLKLLPPESVCRDYRP